MLCNIFIIKWVIKNLDGIYTVIRNNHKLTPSEDVPVEAFLYLLYCESSTAGECVNSVAT